eukprot:TRINITY_DN530_c0_g1_i2.p1 TRINITY_DN530_c0_g1~~TRINITY_DN530_c0_g1_i2.p1  ORF type:complete len:1494 (-),score=399.97 TRINITY_DN530_c0_g1_i2:940-5421(-)
MSGMQQRPKVVSRLALAARLAVVALPSGVNAACSMNLVSSNRLCSVGTIFWQDYTPSAEDCFGRCYVRPDCLYVNTLPPSGGGGGSTVWCRLHSACLGPMTNPNGPAPFYGKTCTLVQTCQFDFVGSTPCSPNVLQHLESGDYVQCSQACENNPQCGGFTLYPMSNQCDLHTSCTPSTVGSDLSSMAMKKSCWTDRPCAVPPIEHGSVKSWALHGDDVQYTCDPDYQRFGDYYNQCWDGTVVNYMKVPSTTICVYRPCQVYTPSSNLISDAPNMTAYTGFSDVLVSAGTNVTFRCMAGYQPAQGPAILTATCLGDGYWSDYLPYCVAIPCTINVTTGLRVSNTFNTVVQSGQSVTFSCDPLYDLVGQANQTCSFGQMSAAQPICRPKPCTIAAPQSGTSSIVGSLASGSTALFECNPGYYRRGAPNATCTLGQLDYAVPTCVAFGCYQEKREDFGETYTCASGATAGQNPQARSEGECINACYGEPMCQFAHWLGGYWLCYMKRECFGSVANARGEGGPTWQKKCFNGLDCAMSAYAGNRTCTGASYVRKTGTTRDSCQSECMANTICVAATWYSSAACDLHPICSDTQAATDSTLYKRRCSTDVCQAYAPANGAVSSDVVAHGGTVTYSCNSGFVLSSQSVLTCLFGALSPSPPTCNVYTTSTGTTSTGTTSTGTTSTGTTGTTSTGTTGTSSTGTSGTTSTGSTSTGTTSTGTSGTTSTGTTSTGSTSTGTASTGTTGTTSTGTTSTGTTGTTSTGSTSSGTSGTTSTGTTGTSSTGTTSTGSTEATSTGTTATSSTGTPASTSTGSSSTGSSSAGTSSASSSGTTSTGTTGTTSTGTTGTTSTGSATTASTETTGTTSGGTSGTASTATTTGQGTTGITSNGITAATSTVSTGTTTMESAAATATVNSGTTSSVITGTSSSDSTGTTSTGTSTPGTLSTAGAASAGSDSTSTTSTGTFSTSTSSNSPDTTSTSGSTSTATTSTSGATSTGSSAGGVTSTGSTGRASTSTSTGAGSAGGSTTTSTTGAAGGSSTTSGSAGTTSSSISSTSPSSSSTSSTSAASSGTTSTATTSTSGATSSSSTSASSTGTTSTSGPTSSSSTSASSTGTSSAATSSTSTSSTSASTTATAATTSTGTSASASSIGTTSTTTTSTGTTSTSTSSSSASSSGTSSTGTTSTSGATSTSSTWSSSAGTTSNGGASSSSSSAPSTATTSTGGSPTPTTSTSVATSTSSSSSTSSAGTSTTSASQRSTGTPGTPRTTSGSRTTTTLAGPSLTTSALAEVTITVATMSVTIESDIATFNATKFVEQLATWFGIDPDRIVVRNVTAVSTRRRAAPAINVWFEISDDPTTPGAPSATTLSNQLFDALTNGGSAPNIGPVLSVTPPAIVVVGGSTSSSQPATSGGALTNPSTSSTQTNNQQAGAQSQQPAGLATGAIIGIVVGAVVLVVVLIVIAVVLVRHRRRSGDSSEQQQQTGSATTIHEQDQPVGQ